MEKSCGVAQWHSIAVPGVKGQLTDGAHAVGDARRRRRAVRVTLPVTVRVQQQAAIEFDWQLRVTDGQGGACGVEIRDDYGRLLFALMGDGSGKHARMCVSTQGPDADPTASTVGEAQFAAGHPRWQDISGDPRHAWQVSVNADGAAGRVGWTLTGLSDQADRADGRTRLTGGAACRAVSVSRIYLVNYRNAAEQAISHLRVRGSRAADALDLPLAGRRIYGFGDSLVAGHLYHDASFATFSAAQEGMSISRWAVDGATVVRSPGQSCIRDQILHAETTAPGFVLMDGGVNDAENIANGRYGVREYEDALRATMDTVIGRWPVARIVFTTTPNLYTRDAEVQRQLHEVQTRVCASCSVTIADVYAHPGTAITPANKARFSFDALGATGLPQEGTNMRSGTHPNFTGIERLYVPTVTAALRSSGRRR